MTVPDHYFDVFEAALCVGVTHETIRHRIKIGDLTEYRIENRALRVNPSELAALTWPKSRNFWRNVREDESGCWIWTAAMLHGYGRWSGGLAYRHSYEELIAAIPDGLHLDHLCRTPPCVNPWHLDPVPQIENIRRHFRLQTHCKHGHEFTPENTYMSRGRRSCRACTARSQREYRARKRAS